MMPPIESLPKPQTPFQVLCIGLVIIRGGEVNQRLLDEDVIRWMAEYGLPTWDSVNKWAEECFELQFGLDLLVSRPVEE
jgi:hypothetical protein